MTETPQVLSRTGLNNRHLLNSILLKDWKTRLFIPQEWQQIAKLGLTSEFQGLLTGRNSKAGDLTGASSITETISEGISAAANAPFLILGVTAISFSNEHVMPTTKGIGSTGEIIHLLGTKNEQITIKFTTNKYPSVMGMYFREIIVRTLEQASIVYLIDEMVGSKPLLLKSYKLNKVANVNGAISGTFNFTTLSSVGFSRSQEADQLKQKLGAKKDAVQSKLGAVKTKTSKWMQSLHKTWSTAGIIQRAPRR